MPPAERSGKMCPEYPTVTGRPPLGGRADQEAWCVLQDGVIPLNPAPHGQPASVHMFWAGQLGERVLTFMEIGIASGGLAKAAAAIGAGMARVVVLFWGKAGYQIGPRGTARPDAAPRVKPWSFDGQIGPVY